MADPFSLATGIAGLISLSLEVTKIAQQYIQGVRHSSKDIDDFLQELAALTDVLRQLDAFLKKDEAGARLFDQTSVLVKTYKACRSSLEKTRSALQSRVNEHRLLKALTWPFVGKEHQEVISAILRWIHTFQFALTIDGCVLLCKASNEVSAILTNQLKTLDETKKIAHVVPGLLRSTEKATDSLSEVLNAVSSLAEIQKSMTSLGETVQNIERIALESREHEFHLSREKKKQAVLQWLSPLDFRPKQLDTLSRRTPSTGEWLLIEENFKSWVDGSGPSCLFCSGIPGGGKTILTSLVINYLESRIEAFKPVVAYIFFDYKDQGRQTVTAILRSLLRQVIESIGEVPQSIQQSYDALPPSIEENSMDEDQCITLLESLIKNKPRDAFFIFDALDECPDIDHNLNEARSRITSAMKRLAIVGRLFITARPHVHPATVIPDYHRLEIRATDPDMRCYIDGRIKEHQRLLRLVGSDPHLADRLNETLCRKANGMFLLTRLQMDSLVSQTSARHVLKALQSLPEKLNESFSDAIDRIKSQSQEYWQLARQVISWIFYAKRPLKISELRAMLAIEPEDTKFNPSGLHESDLILEVCCGLVSIDEQDEIIRLVHYSFQEYLTTCWHGHWPKAEETVAATCLTSLTLEGCSIYGFMPVRRRFFRYACRYWSEHVKGPLEQILEDQIFGVLETEMHVGYAYRITEGGYEVASRTTPLHIVASLGLNHLISVLVKGKYNLDVRDSNGYTPLERAVQTGERTAVLKLLDRGADPNAGSGRGTPLFIASANKDLATMELLVNYGALRGTDNALIIASLWNDATVLQWLLNKGRFRDEDKFEALISYVRIGWVDLVRMLLHAGTNANGIDNESGNTALTIAIRHYHYDVIACLLAAGADPNIRNRTADTPLHVAVSWRYDLAIEALIAANANPDLLDMYGRSCLDLAYPDGRLVNRLGRKLAAYVPTDAMVKKRRIREGINNILRSFYTVWWRGNSDAVELPGTPAHMLNELGHFLLLVGESADARTCFENEPNTIYCDGCPGDGRIAGKRFVCVSCPDADLCEPCMSLQKSQAPSLPSCKDHEFLEISEPSLAKYEKDRVNDAGETFREWLTRLARCYLNDDDYRQLRNELDDNNNKGDGQVEEPEVVKPELKEPEATETV